MGTASVQASKHSQSRGNRTQVTNHNSGVPTGDHARRKSYYLFTLSLNTQLFFFFFTLFFFPESLPRCSPISPFPFPVEPHPITLLVSEELRITVIHPRHTLSQISRLITCPFQLIIPNRTPVHRAIITVSPRNFIIKHTRPLLLSWRVSINNQIPDPLGGRLVCFTRQSHRWLPCPTFFSFLPTHPISHHLISSCNQPTTTPTSRVIPIPNSNSATSPHTPRLLLRKFPFFCPMMSFDSSPLPSSIPHPPRPRTLCLSSFPSVPFARPSVPRIYPNPPVSTLYATPLCPFNFFYSLAPISTSSPWRLGKNADNRRGDSTLAPRSEPDSNTSTSETKHNQGLVQLAFVLLNTV